MFSRRNANEDYPFVSALNFFEHKRSVSAESMMGRPRLLFAYLRVAVAARALHATERSVSDHIALARTSCGYLVLIVALLATMGVTDGAAQPSGTHCDAAYCYVQTCERRPAPPPPAATSRNASAIQS